MLEDSEPLLDMMQEGFGFSSFSSQLIGSSDLWDNDTSDGADAEMPLSFSIDGQPPDVLKEDFQKMLSDWQEHLGNLQASDSEDMDVKDLMGLDMHMSKNVPVEIPTDIFEDSPTALSVDKSPETSKDKIFSGLSLNLNENLSSFNLKNFLEDDDEEEHKFGLLVAEEEELVKKANSNISDDGVEPQISVSSANAAASECLENIKVKVEADEEAVDVETVVDQIPVLEAGDLKSLLEQFEASEAFNTNVSNSPAASPVTSIKESPVTVPAQTFSKKRFNHSTVSCTASITSTINTASTCSKSTVETNRITLHETIRDSLPQEVIDRIKASNRRKPISVIPAMPSRRPGRGATRMQVAAATLSRNKLLKLVSGGGKAGESIQLDHDYCSSAASPSSEVPPPKSFYHSNASEYTTEQSNSSSSSLKDSEDSTCAKSVHGDNKMYCRLPEYYVVLAPQNSLEKGRKGSIKEEVWDKNSRKDSGLESGEVSDASEETLNTPVTAGSRDVISNSNSCVVKSEDRKCGKNIVPSSIEKGVVIADVKSKVDVIDQKKATSVIRADGSQSVLKDWSKVRQDSGKSKPVAMVSVLKKNNVGCTTNVASRQQSLLISSSNKSSSCTSSINGNSSSTSSQTSVETEKIKSEGPKKRKLNLEEYRSRLKEKDRNRVKEEPLETKSNSVIMSSTDMNPEKIEGVSVESKDTVKVEGSSEVISNTETTVSEEGKEKRPVMHSVEVQTQTSMFDEVPEGDGKPKERRSRKKQRKYCSKRASSSSSSHSSNSSRRHRKSRSQVRRRTSKRRSHGGHSVSSSGSQHPRSRSNSSRSSSSYSSYSSRSRSPSRSRSSARHSPSYSHTKSAYPHQNRYGPQQPLPYSNRWRSRSRSPTHEPRKSDRTLSEWEKQRQVEERRVIYVGRIDEGTSKAELRKRFEPFGCIIDISVHFREHGDNYGFVTFAYKDDAYRAVERGNDDPNLPKYELCFGGRRAFCRTRYADLDGLATSDGSMSSSGYMRGRSYCRRTDSKAGDFDLLLREAQAKMRERNA